MARTESTEDAQVVFAPGALSQLLRQIEEAPELLCLVKPTSPPASTHHLGPDRRVSGKLPTRRGPLRRLVRSWKFLRTISGPRAARRYPTAAGSWR